jgi:hypothetical protein
MQLDLTDEEADALLNLLNRAIETDRYQLSPRIRVLRGIRVKLPGAPPEPPPARPPTPEERTPGRAPRALVGLAVRARSSQSYRRSVPVTTISTCRPPHPEQTSRWRQSRTLVAAPYCRAISAGSGSTWWPHALHQTINRTFAFAALWSVIGGPGGDFMSLPL